jgi:hypothetical protein
MSAADAERMAEDLIGRHRDAAARVGSCPCHTCILARAVLSLSAEVARLREENEKLLARRSKSVEIHRRMQAAEAGLRHALDPRYTKGERTFGRALANSAAGMYRDRCVELEVEVARLREYETLAREARSKATQENGYGKWWAAWRNGFDALAARAETPSKARPGPEGRTDES